jgi:hypothetical protein
VIPALQTNALNRCERLRNHDYLRRRQLQGANQVRVNQRQPFSLDPRVAAVFHIGTQLGETLLKRIEHITSPETDHNQFHYEATLLLFLAQGFRFHLAVEHLWIQGFAEESFGLCRNLFELLLQAKYLICDGKTRARAIDLYEDVIVFRDCLREIDPVKKAKLVEILGGQTRLQQMLRVRKSLDRQFPKEAMGWWGHSVGWLARTVHMHDTYKTYYSLQSDVIHSTPRAFRRLLSVDDGGCFDLNCFPSGPPTYSRFAVSGTPFIETMWFDELLQCIAQGLGLNLEDDAHTAFEAVKAATIEWRVRNRKDFGVIY